MSDDALPLCACEQYYESHHPECPARRAHEAALLKLDAAELREKGLRQKIRITEEYATSRLCPDHRGKWERDRCVMCELERAESRLDRIRKLHRDAAMDQSSHHKRDTFMGFLGALGATLDDHPSTTSPVDAHAGGEMSGKHDAACLVSVSGGLEHAAGIYTSSGEQ